MKTAARTVSIMIGRFSLPVGQFVIVAYIARFEGAREVGEYALALAVCTPLFVAFELSLPNVYITLERSISFAHVLQVRTVTILAASLAAWTVGQVSSMGSELLLLVIGSKVLASILGFCQAAFQRRRRLYTVGLVYNLHTLATVLGIVVGHWLIPSTEGALLGYVSASLMVVGSTLALAAAGAEIEPAEATRLDLVKAGFKVGTAAALISILTYAPLYFLGHTAELETSGRFAGLVYFVTFANIFSIAAQQAVIHNYVDAHRKGDRAAMFRFIKRALALSAITGATFLATILAFGPELLSSIWGPAFHVPWPCIVLIASSTALVPFIYSSSSLNLTVNAYGSQLFVAVLSLFTALAFGLVNIDSFTIIHACSMVFIGLAVRAALGTTVALRNLRRWALR